MSPATKPSPPPPAPARIRDGWSFGVRVFLGTLLVLTGLLALSLWKPGNGGRPEARSKSDAADPAAPRRNTHAYRRARLPPPERNPVAALSATNLRPATGVVRPVATSAGTATTARAGFAVRAPGAPTVTNPAPFRTGAEHPVFQALRASRNQPIPPEVASLAREITRNCTTDAERAKAIYDWITSHITYDWKVWADIVGGANAYTQPQDPLSVIQRGSGVCAGYAWLFNALAGSVGIASDFVIGNVRGYRGTEDDTLVSNFRHAWNSVKIGNQWFLMDATWGARQNGETEADYLARRDYYFKTPANQMIYDHLPETRDWQLLVNPLTDEAFRALPNIKPPFFRDNLRLGNAFSDTLAATAGQASGVIVVAPEGVLLTASLSSNGKDISRDTLSLQESGTRHDVQVAPLPAGRYILRIFSKPATNAGPYECAVDYEYVVTE
jgi:transglutaminase-like putative cysteine protease